jgi:murein DD-endopeptidase MepM/ murein hydrolase activator NlpD
VSEKLAVQERAVASEVQQLENKRKQWQALVAKKSRQQKTIETRLRALVLGSKAPSEKPPVVAVGGKGQSGKPLAFKPKLASGNHLFRLNKGRMPCPVNGTISMKFGRVKIKELEFDNYFLTFATTAPGTPVTVIYNGEISSVVRDEEVFTILVKHGDIYTVYGNLKSVSVRKGDLVEGGVVLGYTGINTTSGKSELEFGVYDNKKFIDPEPWINCQ